MRTLCFALRCGDQVFLRLQDQVRAMMLLAEEPLCCGFSGVNPRKYLTLMRGEFPLGRARCRRGCTPIFHSFMHSIPYTDAVYFWCGVDV